MKRSEISLLYCLYFIIVFSACTQKPETHSIIKSYPVDSMDGVITRSGVKFDENVTSDGNGSLRIDVNKPTTLRLYETGDIDIEDALLIYKAKVRTEELEGHAYLEMWCQFSGQGEYFSRALHSPLTGTQEWSTMETTFLLKRGQNPDNVKINLVVDGTSKVCIDDIRLINSPL